MKNMPKHLKFLKAENIEEVFLAEAMGHASAYDIAHPVNKKIILRKGTMIGPRAISILAAYGIDRVFIFRKPQISIIVIGEDLISPGLSQIPGKTYDFSVPALRAALETMKIRPVFVRRLTDKPKKIAKMISFALNQSDILVLVIKEFERDLNSIKSFLKEMQIKKPIFYLPYDSEVIFESFEKYVQPAILKFMGLANSRDIACYKLS